MPAHGLMFHHFHNGKKHIASQGSITGDEFYRMLLFYKTKFNLISAPEWYARAVSGKLKANDVCITFDDALRCQFDIALPILEKLGLKAFWFICTAPLSGQTIKMELYRYYRFKQFANMNELFRAFDESWQKSDYKNKIRLGLKTFNPKRCFSRYVLYTKEDKKFRHIRDHILKEREYESIMDKMVEKSGLDMEKISKLLWMDKNCIKKLHAKGQMIGLHSHTHPTNLIALTKSAQKSEYETNLSVLNSITHSKINVMSHPSNSYNKNILNILSALNIKIGFRVGFWPSKHAKMFPNLQFPRLDHAFLIKEIRK